MNAKEMRAKANKILLPSVEEFCNEAMSKIERHAEYGRTDCIILLSQEQLWERGYVKAFKKFFQERGFRVRQSWFMKEHITIYW